MTSPGAPREFDVVYDGQCRLCVRVLTAMQRWDVTRVMRLYDANDPAGLHTRVAALAGADVDQAMFVRDRSGAVHRGFFAFRRLIRALPAFWPLLPLFYLPGSGVVGPRVYAWVARNRRSLGCGTEARDCGRHRTTENISRQRRGSE